MCRSVTGEEYSAEINALLEANAELEAIMATAGPAGKAGMQGPEISRSSSTVAVTRPATAADLPISSFHDADFGMVASPTPSASLDAVETSSHAFSVSLA